MPAVPEDIIDWVDGVTNFESWTLVDDDTGLAIPLKQGSTADKALMVVSAPTGRELYRAHTDDADSEITVNADAGTISIEANFQAGGPRVWPPGSRFSVDRIRADDVKIPFLRGTARIGK
mgnify:FL=1